jgi:hypothetical protein
MNSQRPQDERVQEAAAERTNIGRLMAVGTVVLWLVTLLLVLGPSVFRSAF